MAKNKKTNLRFQHIQVDFCEKTELELDSAITNLKHFDYIIVPVLAFIAAVWAFYHIGTSIEWDDLLYMNLSHYTTKQAWVLNRYGHIYLQKLFMFLLNNSLAGAKAYWCFLYAGSSILIYWCAKLLAPPKGYINAFLAIGFFLSQPLFFRYAGCTFADMTVMFLLTLGSFIYLAFLGDNQKHRRLVLIIIGAIFFWVVKSKETGICLAVLFLGMGRNEQGDFKFDRLWKDLGWAAVGIGAASFILMLLDACFLKDFFFSVRPSSIKGLMSYNTGEYIHDQKNSSWYTILSMGPISAAFLFYLLAGFKASQNFASKTRLFAWLIPLAVIFFITAIAIQIRADSTIRYIMPAVAIICSWAALCFYVPLEGVVNFNKGKLRIPRSLLVLCILTATFAIAKLITDNAISMVSNAGWISINSFYNSTILPLAITGLIICFIISKKQGLITQAISLLCFFFVIYYPLNENLTSLKNKDVAKQSQWRYEPYRAFANELTFNKDVKIFVSDDIYKTKGMLGRNTESHCWLFNVFFNQKFDSNQFIDAPVKEIQKTDFTYGFISLRDLQQIDNTIISQKYQIIPDVKAGLVFLKIK